ncbi:MAG: hypothetical protein NEA02_13255 [Thermoanaerobaculia bacterium]|nr:hypothetical protein [Thermoanaerobaculia bacterium]
MNRIRLLALFLPLLCASLPLGAQDPFEVQVYEYETVSKGRWNLETHLNYVSKGTTAYEGPMAPTEGQFHTTFELTRGITDSFELAGYVLLGSYTGGSFQCAGARIRPRVMVPKEWAWPVGVSLSIEIGFPTKVFEENGTTLEIRPIFEKKFGAWQLDVNPVVGTALSGPGRGAWDFEPGARFAYEASKALDLSIEYYGAIPFSGGDQVHQIYPGADIHLSPDVVLNVGAGWGLTDAGNRFVWKMRVGAMF